MESKTLECRRLLIKTLANFKERGHSCGILLSGGVDTAAILEANGLLNGNEITIHHAVTVLVSDRIAMDRPYSELIAKKHKLNHTILNEPMTTFLALVPLIVKLLKTFDGMTLRNSLVIGVGLQKLKELGCTTVITGDGADELFAGYSFMWNTTNPIDWKLKRDKQAYNMSFTTSTLAKEMGLEVYSPFTDPDFIDWAVNNTDMNDCVSELPIELSPGPVESRIRQQTGKVCLRLAFPESPAAYRSKEPIEVGSGFNQAYILEYFSTLTSDADFLNEKTRIFAQDSVTIRDKEHLYYYYIFKNVFSDGIIEGHPRFSTQHCCIGCGYQLKSFDSMFCYICGAYPAQI